MSEKIIIPENSKVSFNLMGVGSDHIIKICEANENMEVHRSSLIMIDNGLYCTDSLRPIEKADENTFIVNIWLQDAYVVQNNTLYGSFSDI